MWKTLQKLHRKFPWESVSGIILKISLYLPKLQPKVKCIVFLRHIVDGRRVFEKLTAVTEILQQLSLHPSIFITNQFYYTLIFMKYCVKTLLFPQQFVSIFLLTRLVHT